MTDIDWYRKSEPTPSRADWPSYLYLGMFGLNSVALIFGSHALGWSNAWMLAPLVLLQGLFFMGLLELLHQSVHHNFVMHRRANEMLGTLAAALIGINLVAYRYFHLAHHRHTCDEDDPEGLLYAQSPATRLMALGSPIEHAYVALQINKLAARYVPDRKRSEWMRARSVLLIVIGGLGLSALLVPIQFTLAYLLPLCIFAWIDFFFSQAEHYGTRIRAAGQPVAVRQVSYDVVLPRVLSHLMLNRNLHGIHHVWPRTRWFEAPDRLALLGAGKDNRIISLPGFMKLWLQQGPRLWQ